MRTRFAIGVVVAAFATTSCTRPNPDYCDDSAMCTNGLVCDLSKHECVPTPMATLTVKLEGTGVGNIHVEPINADCDTTMQTCKYELASGTEVKLTASERGSTFVDWLGACTGVTKECSVTVTEQKQVTANFGIPAEHLWTEAFTGGGADSAAVAMGRDGSVVVALRNTGILNIRGTQYAGNSDLLIAKFRRDKSLAWAKQFEGGESYMEPGALDVAANGDVVVLALGASVMLDGQSLSAARGLFIARLDGDTGAKKLLASINTGTTWFAGFLGTHGDELVVAGTFAGSVDLGGGTITSTGTDFLIAWYSATGVLIRTRWITGSGNESANIAVDTDGNLFVAGSYTGTMDMMPGSPGGELAVAEGPSDAYMGQFSWDGTFRWALQYWGPGSDGFYVQLGPSGKPVVFGGSDMGINLNPGGNGGDATGEFIAMFTPDGALQWKYTKGLGGLGVDGRDSVYFTNFCDAQSDFGNGVVPGTGRWCAVRLADGGNCVWAKRFEVSDNAAMGTFRPFGMSVAPNGTYAFIGTTYAALSLEGTIIPANSNYLYVGGP